MISLAILHKVHMIGIKGTGMSGLALLLARLDIRVTGSDAADAFFLIDEQNFRKAGIPIAGNFDANNVPTDADAVVVSTSHRTKNPEINKARKLKIPILTYPEIVGMLTREFRTIAVCGSHGKTTTTNMLAHVLQQSGMPTLALAGPTSQQVLNGFFSPPLKVRGGREEILVLEADEYQNKLKYYSPFGVILTNVELDHPDYFKTERQYEHVFSQFVQRVPSNGFLIDGRKIPYALGEHNKFNARLVTLAAQKLGIRDDDIKKGLASFRGSPRRMEKISDHPLVYDDYGHHPTEIKMTLRALRDAYPDKIIWTVFHPHTFTRTKKFLKEFGASFGDSDHVIVLDIFESREVGKRTISSKDVVAELKKHKKKAYYCPTFADAAKLLKGKLNDDTLLLTIGAGDIWKLHPYVIHRNRRTS